jgi:hypothetical protein
MFRVCRGGGCMINDNYNMVYPSNSNSNTTTTNSNNSIRSSTGITTLLDAIASVFPQRKIERELQITLDPRPAALGDALSFSRNENPSENNTAVTKVQPSAESHDVGRDALLPPSTIDARRTKVQ